MSLAKGIDSYAGFGGEVTYGTKGTIDLFLRIISNQLVHMKDPFFSEALDPDWQQDMYYSGGRNQGSLGFEQRYTGLELFYHALMGTYTYAVDTPVASTNTHTFTYVPSTNSFPVGLSIEAIRGIGGTSEIAYLGMMPGGVTIEFAPRQLLRSTWDLVGQGFSRSAATSPTLVITNPISPSHKTALTLGGNTITILRGSLKVLTPRADDREHYGEALYKEVVINGRPMAEFSFEGEFDDSSNADNEQFLQDYEDETLIDGLVLTHQGDIITGATNYEFGISSTKAKIKAATPTVQDQGATKVTVEGQILQGLTFTMINDTVQVT